MASASQLLADACTSRIACLPDRDLLIVLAQASAGSMATATELLEDACTSGIACLPDKQLLIVIAQATNAGGGAGGVQQVYQDHTGSPPDDPTKPAISFPTGGGTISQWDVGSQTWV